MITSPTTRLAAKAAMITSGRIVRSIVDFLCTVSEAGRDAGGDHLEKHRGAVMEPQCRRAEHGQRAEAGSAPNDHGRHPALRPSGRHQALVGGNRLSHAFQIGPVPGAGKGNGRGWDHVIRREKAGPEWWLASFETRRRL